MATLTASVTLFENNPKLFNHYYSSSIQIKRYAGFRIPGPISSSFDFNSYNPLRWFNEKNNPKSVTRHIVIT